jgi:hypothetical protein
MTNRVRPWRSSNAPAIGLTNRPGRILKNVTMPANVVELYAVSAKSTIVMETID